MVDISKEQMDALISLLDRWIRLQEAEFERNKKAMEWAEKEIKDSAKVLAGLVTPFPDHSGNESVGEQMKLDPNWRDNLRDEVVAEERKERRREGYIIGE